MGLWDTAVDIGHGVVDAVDIAEFGAGHVPLVGTAVHGLEAAYHGGAGLIASYGGGTEKAQHHYTEAAVNAIEAIPLLGTGASIANMIFKHAGPEKGRTDNAVGEIVDHHLWGKPMNYANKPDAPKPAAPERLPAAQQRDKDIKEQAEKDRHQIILEKVKKREADFEASGLSPARFPEWVKEWNAKNGMN